MKPTQTQLSLFSIESEINRQVARGNVTLRELMIDTDRLDTGADASGFDISDWEDWGDNDSM